MSRRLPSLNALRAFEAAARHSSFAKAAEELYVTPAAISYQIKVLEEQLGVTLFDRLKNGLALTRDAEHYLPSLKRAFDGIACATEQIAGVESTERIVVGVLPHFAMRWLIPRLSDFQARHEGIEVWLSTARRKLTFTDDGVDIAIRPGRRIRIDTHRSDLNSDMLFETEIFPVCSPDLLRNRARPICGPADLGDQMLLHCAPSMDDWRIWLARSGCEEIDPEKGPRFDSYVMSIEAAIHGMGFAIASPQFVMDDIERGSLVAPFALTVPQNRAWYLVYPSAALSKRKVALFRDWIIEAVRET